MTEIKVILDKTSVSSIDTLSQDELDLFFEDFANDNPRIPRTTIDSFSAMQTDVIKENNRYIRPELKELLLRKIIQLSADHGSSFNTVIIPIIADFTTASIYARSAQSKYAKSSLTKNKTGGAKLPTRPAQQVKKDIVPNSIKIQFDIQVLAVTQRGLTYLAPPNEELTITGIIINPICGRTRVCNSAGEFRDMMAVAIAAESIRDDLISGKYSYTTLSKSCSGYFPEPNYTINIESETFNKPSRILFSDLGDKKIMLTFVALYNYLVNTELFHKGYETARSIHTQIDLALRPAADRAGVRSQLITALTFAQTALHSPLGDEPARHPILDILESIHFGRFCATFTLALLGDIDIRGFSKIYNLSILKGKDSREVLDEIQLNKNKKDQLIFQQKAREKTLDDQNKLSSFYLIIEKKMGAVFLKDLKYKAQLQMGAMISAPFILSLLKPAERKLVEMEYDRHQKYLEAVINNKCPHVKIYRQLRRSNNDAATAGLIDELKKFFKNPNETNSMITCSNCGFDIICPHVRDFIKLDLTGAFYAEIKAGITKYIDRAMSRDQYFCRICGEIILSPDVFSDDSGHVNEMNEELKNFMWGEIATLMKYLHFGGLVDVPRFISAIRDACYSFIFDIEKQILKSKTNSADEIKAKKRLYITIYAFAYIIHLIISSKSRGAGDVITFKNFVPHSQKTLIVDIIKYVLDTILMSRNIVIREIPGMSPDVIKQSLISAYKSMQSNATDNVAIHASESENILVTLLLDPIYDYFYSVNTVDDIINKKRSVPTKKFDIVDRADDIMGEPIVSLEKSPNIFAKARVPTFKGWREDIFLQLKPMRKGRVTVDGSALSASVFSQAFPGYCAQSFRLFVEKLSSRIYMESLYIDVAGGARGDPNAPMDVKFRPPFETLRKKFVDFSIREQNLFNYRIQANVQGYTFLRAAKTRKWVYNSETTLSRIYDEDGGPHKWDIFIIDAEGATRKEIKIGDITAMLDKGEKFIESITDWRCSQCGILRSTVGTLSEVKIHDSLQARQRVSNFFRFYESRCPKGGLHNFSNENKCTKCSLSNTFLLNTTVAAALNYYREYKEVYMREREEFSVKFSELAPPPDVPIEARPEKFAEEYANWSSNFNIILDLANKIKINHRLLSALGAVEKQEYDAVQSGAYIPSEVDEKKSTRSFVIDTHIKNLITEYNQLRFFHKLVKPSMDLSSIIDSSGINKYKIADLSKNLPLIFNDYNDRFAYFQRYKKAREIVAFCIQSFCEMCLRIWDDPNKETEKLRQNFVSYIVKKILRGEELFSKPGNFNWSLLYGDKNADEKDTVDTNFSEDIDKNDDQDLNEDEKDDDFGDTAAPMAAVDFDIDEDPDRDPADAEDNDQDWKVGDDLGL